MAVKEVKEAAKKEAAASGVELANEVGVSAERIAADRRAQPQRAPDPLNAYFQGGGPPWAAQLDPQQLLQQARRALLPFQQAALVARDREQLREHARVQEAMAQVRENHMQAVRVHQDRLRALRDQFRVANPQRPGNRRGGR